jgi:hypothetical protein
MAETKKTTPKAEAAAPAAEAKKTTTQKRQKTQSCNTFYQHIQESR